MDERKAFEAWAQQDFDLTERDGGYESWRTDCAFAAWQAATLAERERAAKVCEDEAAKWRGEQDITDFKLCAAEIRKG